MGQGNEFRFQGSGVSAGLANDLGNGRLPTYHKALRQIADA